MGLNLYSVTINRSRRHKINKDIDDLNSAINQFGSTDTYTHVHIYVYTHTHTHTQTIPTMREYTLSASIHEICIPILCPPVVKNQLIGKDPDPGKD